MDDEIDVQNASERFLVAEGGTDQSGHEEDTVGRSDSAEMVWACARRDLLSSAF